MSPKNLATIIVALVVICGSGASFWQDQQDLMNFNKLPDHQEHIKDCWFPPNAELVRSVKNIINKGRYGGAGVGVMEIELTEERFKELVEKVDRVFVTSYRDGYYQDGNTGLVNYYAQESNNSTCVFVLQTEIPWQELKHYKLNEVIPEIQKQQLIFIEKKDGYIYPYSLLAITIMIVGIFTVGAIRGWFKDLFKAMAYG